MQQKVYTIYIYYTRGSQTVSHAYNIFICYLKYSIIIDHHVRRLYVYQRPVTMTYHIKSYYKDSY
jgi:hypothetical protein